MVGTDKKKTKMEQSVRTFRIHLYETECKVYFGAYRIMSIQWFTVCV